MKLFLLFTLTTISALASSPKLICTLDEAHPVYKKVEVDTQKKVVALIRNDGLLMLEHKKSKMNILTGKVIDQYEDFLGEFEVQVNINVKKLNGSLLFTDIDQRIGLTCSREVRKSSSQLLTREEMEIMNKYNGRN